MSCWLEPLQSLLDLTPLYHVLPLRRTVTACVHCRSHGNMACADDKFSVVELTEKGEGKEFEVNLPLQCTAQSTPRSGPTDMDPLTLGTGGVFLDVHQTHAHCGTHHCMFTSTRRTAYSRLVVWCGSSLGQVSAYELDFRDEYCCIDSSPAGTGQPLGPWDAGYSPTRALYGPVAIAAAHPSIPVVAFWSVEKGHFGEYIVDVGFGCDFDPRRLAYTAVETPHGEVSFSFYFAVKRVALSRVLATS